MYVQDCIIEWLETYKPDRYTWSESYFVNKCHRGIVLGWKVDKYEIALSIQWGMGNYCDNHELFSASALPKTTDAELAVIFNRNFVPIATGEYPDGTYSYDDVIGYQTCDQIEEFLRAIKLYASSAKAEKDAMICPKAVMLLGSARMISNSSPPG